MTALVGAFGAGKSTLFNLWTRLVESQSGSVSLDDTPINILALTDLRSLVSIVSQDAAPLDETLRDTPILLLDEATSAVDTKSETIVQGALDRLAMGSTPLVIAHRLSTIQNPHKIVVIDMGHVVDEGTDTGLLSQDGLYDDLYHLQFCDGKNRPRKQTVAPKSNARQQSWFARLFNRPKRH